VCTQTKLDCIFIRQNSNVYKILKSFNLVKHLRGVFNVDVGLVLTNIRGSFGGLPLLEGVVAVIGVTHSFFLSLPPLPGIISLLYQNIG